MASDSSNNDARPSRRDALKTGVAAAVAGGASLLGAGSPGAQVRPSGAQTSNVAGRKFRAWVSRGFGPSATTMQELMLLPISGRQVVVRNEATQCCYTMTNRFLGVRAGILPPNENEAQIEGHGGVGTVEAVGPDVRRIKVGDRVIVNAMPQCGLCYGCLQGRRCVAHGAVPNIPIATMADGTPVNNRENMTGGLAELMVVQEERAIPIHSPVSGVEISHLTCVGGCGWGMVESMEVHRGSSIVIFGAGPVGLTSVQAAKIAGPTQIIVVEPMRTRRDVALKLGATAALDPNAEGANLLTTIRNMVKQPTDQILFGGAPARYGPDYIIEAVGHDFRPPKGESGPDGLVALRWAWDLCSGTSRMFTCGVGYDRDATISLPANQFADGDKWHMSGPNGRSKPLRDLPRWTKLIEQGKFDAKSYVTTFPFEKAMDAYQAVADRTIVSAVVLTGTRT